MVLKNAGCKTGSLCFRRGGLIGSIKAGNEQEGAALPLFGNNSFALALGIPRCWDAGWEMPACGTTSRCLPGGRQLSSALCSCRGPVGNEAQGLAEWTLLKKQPLKLIFKPVRNHLPIISVQVKIICRDLYRWFILMSLGWFVTCPAHLTYWWTVPSFRLGQLNRFWLCSLFHGGRKDISLSHALYEADESFFKLDHDPYGAVGGFRGNCKVFVSLKMAN